MYVWVDALTNYLTGVGFPDTDSDLYRRYWPADLHMIGKDIIRFHTVYWPAFLMSAGIELPKKVFAHGFLFNRGEKMSKSVGNVVDPNDLVDTFGVDQVRYFLLREVPFGQDGSYSEDGIIARINADLANEFGNLAQRSLSMVAKNLDGVVPAPGDFTPEDLEMLAAADGLLDRVRAHYAATAMHLALEAIWSVLGAANRYFSAQEPWVLRKTDPQRVRDRAVHDARGGPHRRAAQPARDAGVDVPAARPARPARRPAGVHRGAGPALGRRHAARADRNLPAVPDRIAGVIRITSCHTGAVGGVLRSQAFGQRRHHDRTTVPRPRDRRRLRRRDGRQPADVT